MKTNTPGRATIKRSNRDIISLRIDPGTENGAAVWMNGADGMSNVTIQNYANRQDASVTFYHTEMSERQTTDIVICGDDFYYTVTLKEVIALLRERDLKKGEEKTGN
jgi:predicted nicotinamide N-methyase